MDRATIERAVELGRTDGELRLNAGRWTGSLTTVVGDEAWTIAFEAGSPTSVTDAGGAVPEPSSAASVGPVTAASTGVVYRRPHGASPSC